MWQWGRVLVRKWGVGMGVYECENGGSVLVIHVSPEQNIIGEKNGGV